MSDNLRLHVIVIAVFLRVVRRRLVLPIFYSVVDVFRLGPRRTTRRRRVAGPGTGRPALARMAARVAVVTRWRASLLILLRRPLLTSTRR